MLKEKISFERKEAVILTIDFSGTIEEYALAWLKLTNNAREYRDMIWKISNSKGNNVYVICNPNCVETVKDFCTGIVGVYSEKDNEMHYIGKVIDERKITVGVPVYEYESTYRYDDSRWEDDMDSAIYEWLAVECE
jgi:hypothetical protein